MSQGRLWTHLVAGTVVPQVGTHCHSQWHSQRVAGVGSRAAGDSPLQAGIPLRVGIQAGVDIPRVVGIPRRAGSRAAVGIPLQVGSRAG